MGITGKKPRIAPSQPDKMSNAFEHLKKNKKIYAVVLLFLTVKLAAISSYRTLWWDSAVYIGMGKYAYSLGSAGLWENSRPAVWPLMLGFLWKIGLNEVLFGRVLEIIFGSLCILLVYLIGKRLFNEKTGLLASLFLALSPTFFFFNGVMLTETVSTFFSLLAVYLFIGKKYLSSGIFLGMAFMARFLQLFVLVAVISASYFDKKNTESLKKTVIGFLMPTALHLISSQALYGNALFPFLQQIYLSKNSGWMNYHPISYYFLELLRENFLYLLSIPGIFLSIKNRDTNHRILASIFVLFFAFFNLIKQKEMRFLIVLFPYMYLLASCSIMHIFNFFKGKSAKNIIIALAALSFLLSLSTTSGYYKDESGKGSQYAALQDKIGGIAEGSVWISSPVISAFSDRKIDNLVYYPVFDEGKKNELIKESAKADFVFIDSCDLACRPADLKCDAGKKELLDFFKQKLKNVYSSVNGRCCQFIFQK